VYKHVKSDVQSKIEDTVVGLIRTFIKSHIYGTVLTCAIIFTGVSAITNAVREPKNPEEIEVVEARPADVYAFVESNGKKAFLSADTVVAADDVVEPEDVSDDVMVEESIPDDEIEETDEEIETASNDIVWNEMIGEYKAANGTLFWISTSTDSDAGEYAFIQEHGIMFGVNQMTSLDGNKAVFRYGVDDGITGIYDITITKVDDTHIIVNYQAGPTEYTLSRAGYDYGW